MKHRKRIRPFETSNMRFWSLTFAGALLPWLLGGILIARLREPAPPKLFPLLVIVLLVESIGFILYRFYTRERR
jgi:hypothetical protein